MDEHINEYNLEVQYGGKVPNLTAEFWPFKTYTNNFMLPTDRPEERLVTLEKYREMVRDGRYVDDNYLMPGYESDEEKKSGGLRQRSGGDDTNFKANLISKDKGPGRDAGDSNRLKPKDIEIDVLESTPTVKEKKFYNSEFQGYDNFAKLKNNHTDLDLFKLNFYIDPDFTPKKISERHIINYQSFFKSLKSNSSQLQLSPTPKSRASQLTPIKLDSKEVGINSSNKMVEFEKNQLAEYPFPSNNDEPSAKNQLYKYPQVNVSKDNHPSRFQRGESPHRESKNKL